MISYTPMYPTYSMYGDDREEGNLKPVTQTLSVAPQDAGVTYQYTPPQQVGQDIQVAGPVTPEIMDQNAARAARAARAATAAAAVAGVPGAPVGNNIPAGASEVTKVAQTFGSATDPSGWMNDITKIQNDPNALASYVGNNSNSAAGRELARSLLLQVFEGQKRQQEAQQKVDRALEGGNMLELARETQKSGDEGSYIKAYLYKRLGLEKLAQDEQEKLSPTFKWERALTVDNKPALIKTDRRGMPVEGYTGEGRMTDKELINIGSSAMNLDIVGGTYVNDRTGQVGRVVTDRRTGISYIQTDAGRVGMAGFRPQSSGGGLADMAARQYQEARIKFETEPSIATATEYLKFARTVDTGDGNMIRSAQEAISRLPFGQQVLSGVGATPTVPSVGAQIPTGPAPVTPQMVPGAAPTVAPSQVTPSQTAPVAAPVTRPGGGVVPGAPIQGARPIIPGAPVTPPGTVVPPVAAAPVGAAPVAAGGVTPVAPTRPGVPAPFVPSQIRPGESPSQYAERQKRENEAYQSSLRQAEAAQQAGLNVGVAQQTAAIENQKLEERRRQESIEANRKVLSGMEENATNMLTTIKDVVTHPGFKDVIGMPGVTGVLPLPGTDARNFLPKYEQLKGQQFLVAFDRLRGAGSISEIEGTKATQAIAALNDKFISEKEFKRNADILVNVIQTGVDRQRIRSGFEPKYKPFTTQERQAFEFIQANPNDPRSSRIRNVLENR